MPQEWAVMFAFTHVQFLDFQPLLDGAHRKLRHQLEFHDCLWKMKVHSKNVNLNLLQGQIWNYKVCCCFFKLGCENLHWKTSLFSGQLSVCTVCAATRCLEPWWQLRVSVIRQWDYFCRGRVTLNQLRTSCLATSVCVGFFVIDLLLSLWQWCVVSLFSAL